MKTKIALIVMTVAFVLLAVFVVLEQRNKKKPVAQQDPGTNYMTLTNRTFYVKDGVVLVPMSTNEFAEVAQRFPTNMVTDSLRFFAPR